MTQPHAALLGLATALPPHSLDQLAAAEWLCEHFGYGARVQHFVRRLHSLSGIATRHSVLPDFALAPGSPERRLYRPGRPPDIAARMEIFAAEAPALAARACERALAHAGVEADEVTHTVLVTSTGFMTPGPDVALVRLLGLRDTVERTVVAMHGCAGASAALGLAAAIARGDARAVVLVAAVELCTIHLGTAHRRQALVANALFGDGAAAAVVAAERTGREGVARLGSRRTALVPDSGDVLTWTPTPEGFELALGHNLPRLVQQAIANFVGELARSASGPQSFASWAVHTGGSAVLAAVRDGLCLADEALAPSYASLRQHDNVSSASALFALERVVMQQCRDNAHSPTHDRGLLLAFGPGLCMDAIVYALRGRTTGNAIGR